MEMKKKIRMLRKKRNGGIYQYLYMVQFFLLLILANGQVTAQIVVKSDSVAKLGQTFKLNYQYCTNDSTERIVSHNFEWEKNNSGFDILMGPSRSTQTSTKVTNGKISVTYGETFTFLISFNKEGRYNMPIMKAQTSSGKEVVSKPFSVRVNKEAVSSTPNISSTQKPLKNDLLVVEATVNKHRISLGDSVECEIRLYTKYSVINQIRTSSTFSASPAYWHEHELPMERSLEKVEYRGEPIHSFLWSKYSIIPLQAGEIVLEPMKFIITVKELIPGVDPFEAIFNSGSAYIERDTVIFTNPIKIQVDNKQLPDQVIAFDSNPTHNCGLVIDRSSSLKASNDSLAPTLLQLENLFVEQLTKSKVLNDYSVTLFAGKTHYPKSSQLTDILKISPSEENDGSAIYDAILASALRDGALTTERPSYSVLLLTDGFDNSSRLSEKTLINILHQRHIKVHVIVFASEKDSVYYFMNDTIGGQKIKNTQDFSDVERIAKATDGLFIKIHNKKLIPDAIRKIKDVQSRQTPYKQPDNDFLPEPYLLNLLYKEIEQESIKGF